MTTFEILTLAEELKSINNEDITRAEYDFNSNGFKLDIIGKEDGYWSVYADEYNQETEEWTSTYICTKSVFSMEGDIADAIDQVIEFLKNNA